MGLSVTGSLTVTKVMDGLVYEWIGDDALVSDEVLDQLFAAQHNDLLPWKFTIVGYDNECGVTKVVKS